MSIGTPRKGPSGSVPAAAARAFSKSGMITALSVGLRRSMRAIAASTISSGVVLRLRISSAWAVASRKASSSDMHPTVRHHRPPAQHQSWRTAAAKLPKDAEAGSAGLGKTLAHSAGRPTLAPTSRDEVSARALEVAEHAPPPLRRRPELLPDGRLHPAGGLVRPLLHVHVQPEE